MPRWIDRMSGDFMYVLFCKYISWLFRRTLNEDTCALYPNFWYPNFISRRLFRCSRRAAALCRIFVVASFSVKSRNIINEFNLKLNWCTRAFSLTSNLLYARARICDDRCILRYYEMRFVRYPVITGGINLPALGTSRWCQCYIYIFIFIITSLPDGAGYIFKVAITIHEVNSLNISSLYVHLPVALSRWFMEKFTVDGVHET